MTTSTAETAESAGSATAGRTAEGQAGRKAPAGAGHLLEADFVVARRNFPVSLTLELAEGERFSLFGTSGAGKTTCLEAIAGWARLEHGYVRLDGRLINSAGRGRGARTCSLPVDPRDRGVALVRQPTTLFPHLSVRANVGYGVRRPRPRNRAQLDELIDRVGLAGLGEATPDSLSGGQRQRASFARALVRPFKVLLLDEPFSAVDASGRAALRRLAAEEVARADAAAVLVTHDLAEAQAFGDRLGIMDGGELLQIGAPDEVVRRPSTVRVADLCGYRSYVPQDGGRLWALHPDRIVEGTHPDRGVVISGRVRSIEPHGPRYACEMLVSDDTGRSSLVRVNTGAPPPAGEMWTVTAVDPPLVRGDRTSNAGGG